MSDVVRCTCPVKTRGSEVIRLCDRTGVFLASSPKGDLYRCSKGHTFRVDREQEEPAVTGWLDSIGRHALLAPDPGQEPAHARSTDPSTSHEAAESMSTKRINTMQLKALTALARLGGRGINDQVVERSGKERNAITPRMRPLCNKGLVREAGKRKSERTNSRQIVWQITNAGYNALTDAGDHY